MHKVLVYPAGTEVGLEVARCLAFSKHFTAVGVNSVVDHSEMLYPRVVYGAPRAVDPAAASFIAEVAQQEQVRFIVPAHDDALYNLGLLSGTLPAQLVGPSATLAPILRSKAGTYRALGTLDFVPRLFRKEELPDAVYPLFGRPDRGQGSVGAQPINSVEEAEVLLARLPDAVITEFLPGAEYTVDCYSDQAGTLMLALPRERLRIRGGICVRSVTSPDPDFRRIANEIAKILRPKGVWFFQCKRGRDGQLFLLEVANRLGGGIGYQRLRGMNLLQMWLFDLLGVPVSTPHIGRLPEYTYDRALEERVRWSNEYSIKDVYVDLDDTIRLSDGTLNYKLVGILFGLKSRHRCQIHLITRHALDPHDTVLELGLAPLFNQIHHITDGSPKSGLIVLGRGSIFIDDSHRELEEVRNARPDCLCLPLESLALLEGALRA